MPGKLDPTLAKILESQPELDSFDVDEMREHATRRMRPWTEKAMSLVYIEKGSVRGGHDDRPLWIVRAPQATGSPVFYVHGGGWTVCDLHTHLPVFAGLSTATGSPVHAIHHRRAPEDPYPAALEDVAAALRTMSKSHPEGFGVAGDSAGANLALATLLYLRDQDESIPVSWLILYYGCYLRKFDTEAHRLYGDGSIGLSTEKMRLYWDLYAKDHSTAKYSDLSDLKFSGLPPIQVHAAELDILRDDTFWLADQLEKAGNRSELLVWEGMNHGFLHYAPELKSANEVFEATAHFVNAASDDAA